MCTSNDIFDLRQRCMLLCAAYIQAKKWMGAEDTDCRKTWHECCESACSLLNPLGVEQTVNFRRVAHYNLLYRQKEIFPNPRPEIGIGKKPLPLHRFPRRLYLLNNKYKYRCKTIG